MKRDRDRVGPRAVERPGRVLSAAFRAPSESWLLRTLHELRREDERPSFPAAAFAPSARRGESAGENS